MPETERFTIGAEEGDVILICSDGLTDMVDDRAILDAVERHRDNLDRLTKQLDTRRAFPLRIGVGKMPADVAGAGGAQNRVGNGVTDRVGVGMSRETALERDRDASENQRPAFDEPMQVVDQQGQLRKSELPVYALTLARGGAKLPAPKPE